MLIFEKCRFGWKLLKNLEFSQMYGKISIFVEIYENLNFGWNLLKISFLVGILDFGPNFWKPRFCAKLLKNLAFGRNFEKYQFWQKFWKIPNLVGSFENLDFFFEISENRDFGHYFRKMSIVARIFVKSLSGWKFLKNLDLIRNFEEISIWVNILEKFRFY